MGGKQLIPGLHPIREALTGGRFKVLEIWVREGKRADRVEEILQLAKGKGVRIEYKKSILLDNLLPGTAHQGIIAFAHEFQYVDLNHLVNASLNAPDYAVIVVADHITDEGNLGALIRTSAFFRAQGLILPKDRSAGVTENVLKRSAGYSVHLPVAQVVNLGRTLDFLDKKGFWIIGAAGEGRESIYRFDWNRNLVLILGSEHKGISRSVRDRCHQLVSIPASGDVSSLNVSIAGGVILSEIARQRGLKNEGNQPI